MAAPRLGVGGWVGGLGKQCRARGWNRGRPGSRRCPKPQPSPSFGSPGASRPRGMERTNPKASTSPSGGDASQPSQTPRLWAVGCLLPTHCGRGCTDEPQSLQSQAWAAIPLALSSAPKSSPCQGPAPPYKRTRGWACGGRVPGRPGEPGDTSKGFSTGPCPGSAFLADSKLNWGGGKGGGLRVEEGGGTREVSGANVPRPRASWRRGAWRGPSHGVERRQQRRETETDRLGEMREEGREKRE